MPITIRYIIATFRTCSCRNVMSQSEAIKSLLSYAERLRAVLLTRRTAVLHPPLGAEEQNNHTFLSGKILRSQESFRNNPFREISASLIITFVLRMRIRRCSLSPFHATNANNANGLSTHTKHYCSKQHIR